MSSTPYLLLFCFFCPILKGSQTRSSGPAATNEWQLEARHPKPVISSPELSKMRAARDAYADKVYGVGITVDQIQERQLGYTIASSPLPTGQSDLPRPYRDEVVVVGYFNNYDVVLSTSKYSIYSEMHIGFDSVLYGDSPAPSSGSSLDVLTEGGTIITSANKTLSFKTQPRGYGLTPGHRYVLFLRYIAPGNFYLLTRSIELANGDARPNFPDDEAAAEHGHWLFAQTNESQVIDMVRARVQAQHR